MVGRERQKYFMPTCFWLPVLGFLTPTIPKQNPGSYSPSTYGQDQGKGENVVKAFSIPCSFLTFLCHSSPNGFKQPAAERWKITMPNILVTLQLVTKCSVRKAKDDKTYGTLQIQQVAYAVPLITSHLTCYSRGPQTMTRGQDVARRSH